VQAKTYPGPRLVKGRERAKQEVDYGRREAGFVYGILLPSTGDVLTHCYTDRSTDGWIDFLERAEAWLPPHVSRVFAIVDNLSSHHAKRVLLFAASHPRWEFLFLPTASAYLNLIEPWWKILRSLALKGRRFECWADMITAIEAATDYWNSHKHPFRWGRRRKRAKPSCTIPRLPGIRLCS
jgi:transposase